MKKQFRTKLAKRMNAEFMSTTEFNLSEDLANLLAEGVDNGIMRAGKARMVAALATDWEDAALSDATETLHTLHETTTAEQFDLEDNVLINQMKEAHGLLDDGSQDNVLLQDMKERIAADAF